MHIRRVSILAFTSAIICFCVFLRAVPFDFVNIDDPFYVYNNPAIKIMDLTFIKEAFTTSYMGWWMPLTWISFAVDYLFWGLDPFGYHLTNILLHSINSGLVVLIAAKLITAWINNSTLDYSNIIQEGAGWANSYYSAALLLAGLLWGVHPLRVEAVVWVTERKDVLNGVFSLLSLLYYIRYAQQRGNAVSSHSGWGDYLISCFCLLLSLMAKPISVMLPAIFLVLDFYPLGRLNKKDMLPILLEKVPFLLLSVGVAAGTILLASGESILVSFEHFPLSRRLIMAGNSIAEYVRMSIFPYKLVHLYLLPRVFPPLYYINALVVLLFTAYCFFMCRKRPWLIAGWLTFVIPLFPVLGIFQNGSQSHADRFTYLPSILPSIMVSTLLVLACCKFASVSSERVKKIICIALIVVPTSYGMVAFHLIGAWRNSETLWSRLITIRPAGRAYYYRAVYYVQHMRFDEAVRDLAISIRMAKAAGKPDYNDLLSYHGDALSKAGRYKEAIVEFTAAISMEPHANYYYQRGLAYKALGLEIEAINDFLMAGDDTRKIDWN